MMRRRFSIPLFRTIGVLSFFIFSIFLTTRWLAQAAEVETAVFPEEKQSLINQLVETVRLETIVLSETTYLPLVVNNFDTTLGTPLFGVQMYGSTSNNSPYNQVLIESKASWVRVQVNWRSVEPVPTTRNWGVVDDYLAAARVDMGGVNIIGTIDAAPDWAVEDSPLTEPAGWIHGPIDPDDLDEFADFVGALVERFDGDGIDDAPGSPVVNYWEFYNEPDNGGTESWNPAWGDHGTEYAIMLSYAYPAVKAANGKAQVVMGGIAYDWFYNPINGQGGKFNPDFINDVLAAGGGNYFDIMNFHYYPAFKHNWLPPGGNGPGLLEKTQAVRALLAQYGLGQMSMVITEAGWHSDSDEADQPSSPEIQARYVAEFFTQSMAGDVDVMIWWTLNDIVGWRTENGLVTFENPPVKKISFDAFQTIVNELSTTHFERKLSNGETGAAEMEVYQFNDNVYRRKVYVAWLNPVDNNAVKTLTLPGSQATIRSLYGDVLAIKSGVNNVTVQVSGQPVFVEIAK